MATISYDGQSLLIDGRRIWLVSGAIHYARSPHQLWRSRIRAAKQAGLNCIETHVFWNIHEPRPGKFHFEGNADLRRFIQIIAHERMYCILRPGPYIGADWDFGGLPGWLNQIPDIALREASGPFLEACSRYVSAVMDQVRDLQIASPVTRRAAAAATGGGGPIIMIQAENEWFCHNPKQGDAYLREITRYLRESGCAVPISVCNNLWQRVDGAIDTWNADSHLAADLRQLRIVQPDAPRIVSEFWLGGADHWGGPHLEKTPATNLYQLTSMLAVGAQFNMYMFHGGTSFGFHAGRRMDGPACFMTTSYDYDAPLLEAGGRGAKYKMVKRICMFASQFGHVLAHMDPEPNHTAVALSDEKHPVSVIQQNGSQGAVIFLIKAHGDKTTNVDLMLPDGQKLPVPIGDDRAAWLVLNTNLGGVAELTYTSFRPWAFLGKKILVLFGPPAAKGLVCVNGAPLSITVPTGDRPTVTEHEDLIVVLLNPDQVDAAYVLPEGLIVGAAGLDDNDQPIPDRKWSKATRITTGGQTRTMAMAAEMRPTRPHLDGWHQNPMSDLMDGSSERFEPIDGPASLEQLDCEGYGLYRIVLKSAGIGGKLLAPLSGDRLHVYCDGKLAALMGHGPGAAFSPVPIELARQFVVLADNLGHFNAGWGLGESKGLFGHFYDVKPVHLSMPEVVSDTAPDPFELRGFYTGLRQGEEGPTDVLVWQFKPEIRKPMILDLGGLPLRAKLIINDVPLAMVDPHYSAGLGRFLLEPGQQITGGRNVMKLALFESFKRTTPLKFVKLYQTTGPLTAKASWAFTPLPKPKSDAFEPLSSHRAKQPCWYRCFFSASRTDVPLWFEPRSLSKGQIYINGHNAGRYFIQTHTDTPVPPQKRYYLPEPWLRTDQPNELLIFEEHGRSPRQSRLAYDPMGPYGDV